MTSKIIVMLVSTVTSAIGWWLGAQFGIMTAFMVSTVAMGVGIWLGKKYANHLGL